MLILATVVNRSSVLTSLKW